MNIIKTMLRTLLMVGLFMLSACQPTQYTITYHPNGGSQPEQSTIDGKSAFQIPVSSREGFTFEGWYRDDGTFTQKVISTTFVTTPLTTNLDVYAKWSRESFGLIFVENGGPLMSDRTIEFEATIDVGPDPVREGYTFDGWYTNQELATPFTATTMPAHLVTLYAKWLLNNYTMHFEVDGGSTTFPHVVPYGVTMTAPVEPTKSGYTFGGWYLNETFTQAFIEQPMPAHDVTLYAKWNVMSYTLQFLNHDGSVIWSQSIAYGTDLSSIAVTVPDRIGYTHSGWSNVLPATMPLYNVTLTALYHHNMYFITYDSAEGTSVDAWSGHYGDSMPAEPTSERLGYTLEGWYLDEERTLPYLVSTMPAHDLRVYAKWTAISYTITYESNGGDSSTLVSTYSMETLPIVLGAPTRVGYAFEGWFTQSDFSGERNELILWPQIGDIALYAKWSLLEIPVSYYLVKDLPEGTVTLALGERIVQVGAGEFSTLVLTTDHRVIGWGYNTFGALGPSGVDEIIPPFDMTPHLNLHPSEYPTRVSGGFYTSFVWTNQNRVMMLGSNLSGEFAVGVSDYDPHPHGVDLTAYLPLLEGETIVEIANNYRTMAVLTSHHRLLTWGLNDVGKTGDGTTTLRLTPFLVNPALNLLENEIIVDIDMGSYHMIALSSLGRVWTWGHNGYGQLGNGTLIPSHVPLDITSFIPLISGDRVSAVAAGATHNILLTTFGKVLTFGNNATGELATTDWVERKVPTDVSAQFPLAMGETIVQLETGEYHNAILTSHHRMLLWGTNAYGMQGDGTQVDHAIPVEITALVSPETSIRSIILGGYSSIALLDDGTLRMWGQNFSRLLNLDGANYTLVPTTHDFAEPMELFYEEEILFGSDWVPYEMGQPGYTFSGWYTDIDLTIPYGVDVKDEQPLALYGRYEETVYTITFQLDGGWLEFSPDVRTYTLSSDYIIYDTPVKEGHSFEGWYLTPTFDGEVQLMFAPGNVLGDFNVYAKWSVNTYQLAYATTDDATNTFAIPLLPNESLVSIQYGFNFVMLLTSTGRVFSWGANTAGQLGNGTWVDSSVPVEITAQFNLGLGDHIVEIGTGSSFTIARSAQGHVFTWGYNNVGQLGDWNTPNRNLPGDISLWMSLNYDEKVTKIYAGSGSGFAVTSYGRFLVWGTNVWGELGDNLTSTYRRLPYDNTSALGLQAGETIVSLSSKGSHTWIVTSSGRLIGWGRNSVGQLGMATPTTVRVPTDLTALFPLTSGETIITAASGDRFSLIATSHGRVFTMGSNDHGELGNGTTTSSNTPLDITAWVGLHPLETIVQATFGYAHLLALTSEGRLLGWGRNWAGEVGDLTTTTRYQAVDVTASIPLGVGEAITNVAAQIQLSAITTNLHRVFIWGYNTNYQQLNGGVMDVVVPHEIQTIQFMGVDEPTLVDYGTILPSILPVREGYHFSGWYIDIHCTTAWTGTLMPGHDLYLYGRWTIQP